MHCNDNVRNIKNIYHINETEWRSNIINISFCQYDYTLKLVLILIKKKTHYFQVLINVKYFDNFKLLFKQYFSHRRRDN